MVSELERFLGFQDFPIHIRIGVEIVFVLLLLACAVAVRSRRRSLSVMTFLLLAGSFVLSIATHLIPNQTTAEKVGTASIVTLAFGLIRLGLEGIDALTRRRRAHFSTIFRDLIMLVMWGTVLMVVAYTDFGVKPTQIFTATTVFAAVIGLALQETMSNIFSGLTLQVQRPFEPGDWIRTGNFLGRVRGIGWRATTIITRGNQRLEVPNSVLGKDVLISYGDGAICDEITIGISYDVAPNRVREVVMRLLHNDPQIMKDPPPDVLAWEFGESAIQYRIKYWLRDYGPQETVRDNVVSSLWYVLRRHAIEVPYPIRTVEMREHQVASVTRDDARLIAELRRVDFLRGLGDEEIKVLVPTVQVREFGAGETIMRQGEEGDSFYILRRGVAEVMIQTPDGSLRHLNDLHPPSFFGEAAMVTGEPRNASVRAKTDLEVIEMDREGFTRLFQSHPEAAEPMSEIIATRMTQRLEVLANASGDNANGGARRWLMNKMREIFDF